MADNALAATEEKENGPLAAIPALLHLAPELPKVKKALSADAIKAAGNVTLWEHALAQLIEIAVKDRAHNIVGGSGKAIEAFCSKLLEDYPFVGQPTVGTQVAHYKELVVKKAPAYAEMYANGLQEYQGTRGAKRISTSC